MNTILYKALSAGLFFLLIFLLGFWLSRSSKPYPSILFTIHKLVALGAVIFLAVTFYRAHQAAPLSPAQIAAIAFAGLCFLATILTGGLLSIDKTMPAAVSWAHKLFPYLTALSSEGALYLLLVSGR